MEQDIDRISDLKNVIVAYIKENEMPPREIIDCLLALTTSVAVACKMPKAILKDLFQLMVNAYPHE